MLTSNKNLSGNCPTYRAAIIGCGRIGCGFDDDPKRKIVSTHAGAYSRSSRVDLVALADLDSSLLQRYGDKFQVSQRYSDYRQMLQEAKPDLLSICTPNETHSEIVGQAVKAGVRGIFCEKPIAESLQSADRMIAECKEAGCFLQIDHQRRFDPVHQKIREFLQEGRLGRVQQVTCYYTAGTANTGSHMIDLIRFLFGDIDCVQGWMSPNPSPNEKDPNIDGWLQTKAGFPVAIQMCDVKAYLIFEMNIIGTLGRFRIQSSGFDLKFECVGDSPFFSGYQELLPSNPPIDLDCPREFMQQGVEHLVQCLDRNRISISSGEDGRAALEIICALYESAQEEGKPVRLPLRDSRITIKSR